MLLLDSMAKARPSATTQAQNLQLVTLQHLPCRVICMTAWVGASVAIGTGQASMCTPTHPASHSCLSKAGQAHKGRLHLHHDRLEPLTKLQSQALAAQHQQWMAAELSLKCLPLHGSCMMQSLRPALEVASDSADEFSWWCAGI